MLLDDIIAACRVMSVAGLDHRAIVGIAEEMTQRNPTRPAHLRWWADLLGWNDPFGKGYNLTHAARDAGVLARNATAGTLTPNDAASMCRVLTERRDALFGTWLRDGDAYWRKSARELATLAGDNTDGPVARAAADNLARADACAAALAPLTPAPDPRRITATPAREATTVPVPIAYGPRAPFECGKCAWVWTPRVDRPRKCPRCQGLIAWPDEGTTADA